jgi:hypothetical protein
MSNRKYQYLDADLNPQNAADHTLLMQVGAGNFSFAVTDGRKLLLLADNASTDELNGPNGEDDLLFRNYGRRIIGLSYTGFTLLPLSIFEPEKTAGFARFLDVKPTEKIFSQSLDTENQVIFKACGEVSDSIAANFDLNNVVFGPAGWIKAIAGNSPADKSLYLNISGNQAEILNFTDDKIRFYNRFEFMSEDELAYFATVVAGELDVPPMAVSIYVSGNIADGDRNFNRLKKFFGRVYVNPVRQLQLPGEFASHTLLSLTALTLCGSLAAH